jgi:hypothetical protein
MITWFGYRELMVFSKFESAFSWEDVYSNILGVRAAAEALRDPGRMYDKAVTAAIDRHLRELGVQPADIAKQAAAKMKGKWFSGSLVVNVRKRNLDIGLDDGYITPVTVPSVVPCAGAKPRSYPVPTLDALARHGFTVEVAIEPRTVTKKVLGIAGAAGKGRYRIVPEEDFPVLMDRIREEAVEKHGFDVGG